METYSSTGDIQILGYVGFVEAFTREVHHNFSVEDAANDFLTPQADDEPKSNISIPISYSFEMEDSITFPSDPANFIINLQNFDTNITAPGLDVKVNLSIYSYTSNFVDYDLILPPIYPIQNTTYIDGDFTRVNFTVVDKTLYWGEGLILNGLVNTTKTGIIIYYVWTLIVDGIVIYSSPDTTPENRIIVE